MFLASFADPGTNLSTLWKVAVILLNLIWERSITNKYPWRGAPATHASHMTTSFTDHSDIKLYKIDWRFHCARFALPKECVCSFCSSTLQVSVCIILLKLFGQSYFNQCHGSSCTAARPLNCDSNAAMVCCNLQFRLQIENARDGNRYPGVKAVSLQSVFTHFYWIIKIFTNFHWTNQWRFHFSCISFGRLAHCHSHACVLRPRIASYGMLS